MKIRISFAGPGSHNDAVAAVNLTAQELQAAATPQPQLAIPAEFRHASEFVRLLEQSGLAEQEVLRSGMEATFEGVRSAERHAEWSRLSYCPA